MTDIEKKMMEMLGISEDDFEAIDKDELYMTAYVNSELALALLDIESEV